jgi:periplasmic protein TonB
VKTQNLESNPRTTVFDFDAEQKPSRRLWLFAAATALLLHIGGAALAVTYLRDVEPEDSFGAPAIEIGLEMSSPHLHPTDLPAGPDKDATEASAAQAEQKAELRETELPHEQPAETDDPDRVVAPNSVNKPKEDDPSVAKVASTASVESIATEATAMPSSESIPETTRAVAPAQGAGSSRLHQRASWQKELVAYLDRHKRYPASRSQRSAEIMVGFVLDRRGHVLSTSIIKGSGDAAFDEAALAMVKRSDPVPPPPPEIADEGLNFTLPVIFKVKGKS